MPPNTYGGFYGFAWAFYPQRQQLEPGVGYQSSQIPGEATMRSLSTLAVLLLGLILAAAALADPPGKASAPNSGPFQFVGYSSMQMDGLSGVQAIYETCQFNFGPESRVCGQSEFIASPNAKAPPGPAWLNIGNCQWYSATHATDTGAGVFNDSGRIAFDNSLIFCNTDAYVTCCARLQ